MKLFHMSLVLAILFQAPCKMDSNICKGTKNDFSYFVDMALQNRMPWKTLASLLTDLAPTLNDTREVISILLKELEALKSTLQSWKKVNFAQHVLTCFQLYQVNFSALQS